MREHLAAEEAREPDALFAEVAHLPHGRMGNVVLRPRLRAHEIVLDADAGAPGAIALADLDLALEDGRLVLRRDGRRVLPRLTCAHNAGAHGTGLYRFLAALARQDVAGALAWDWGAIGAAAPRTPRVTCGRLVLDVARWRVPAEALRGDQSAVHAWRRAEQVPRLVAVGGADAPLPVDLGHAAGVRLLAREAPATVAEWWPAPDALPVTGPGGRHVHELVVPFTRAPDPEPPPAPRGRPRVARTFPPGSGWLYAKLYAGAALHDGLLLDELAPVARAAVGAGDAERWHVVRHADPDAHLRLRLRGEPERLRARVLPRLEAVAAAAIADGRAWRLVLDTYERELERYGDPERAEAVFAADSDCVVELLATEPAGLDAASARWRLGTASALRLVLDLGIAPAAAGAVLDRCRGGLTRDERRTLARTQRGERAALDPLVAAALGLPGADAAVAAALARRTRRLAGLGPWDPEVAASLVHMHLNRLLRLPARDLERAACDAGARALAGALARERATSDRARAGT